MLKNPLEYFFLVGISFKKSEAKVRSAFALHDDQYERLLELAEHYHIRETFALSTCNRTEVYGFTSDPDILIHMLCEASHGSKRIFKKHAYVLNGEDAVAHFFRVTAGLDSQIPGDYEIISQIKKAAQFAKSREFLGSFTERLINDALASSKHVKNKTSFSSGLTSTSYAVIQYLKYNIENLHTKKILVVGAGNMGKNICWHLRKICNADNITLLNRNLSKAEHIAADFGIQYGGLSHLGSITRQSEIIICAICAPFPVLKPSHLDGSIKERHVIDLSMPSVVEKSLQNQKHMHFVGIDVVSKVKDDTLEERMKQIPAALRIIHHDLADFLQWNQKRKYVPYLNVVKGILKRTMTQRSRTSHFPQQQDLNPVSGRIIQKVINQLAVDMKSDHHYGCLCVQAINSFLDREEGIRIESQFV